MKMHFTKGIYVVVVTLSMGNNQELLCMLLECMMGVRRCGSHKILEVWHKIRPLFVNVLCKSSQRLLDGLKC